jgi:hypothetical protein
VKFFFGGPHRKVGTEPARMSVFRRGVKIRKGALHDELSSSSEDDDDDEVESQTEEERSDDEDQKEDEKAEESDDSEVDLGWRYTPKPEEELPPQIAAMQKKMQRMKEIKEKRESKVAEDEDEVEEEEEDDDEVGQKDVPVDDGEIRYPLTCAICDKVLFTKQSAEEHMNSKGHKKNEELFNKHQKVSKRTAEQVDKLKARNQRKKEKRMQRRQQERDNTPHVWGDHKFPGKNGGKGGGAAGQKPKAMSQPPAERKGAQGTDGGPDHNKKRKAESGEPKEQRNTPAAAAEARTKAPANDAKKKGDEGKNAGGAAGEISSTKKAKTQPGEGKGTSTSGSDGRENEPQNSASKGKASAQMDKGSAKKIKPKAAA